MHGKTDDFKTALGVMSYILGFFFSIYAIGDCIHGPMLVLSCGLSGGTPTPDQFTVPLPTPFQFRGLFSEEAYSLSIGGNE